ncbi:MAG TPA: DUF3471 domain-containing protein [Chloroflexota bacterium]|nr:DUF3471 domain-containing protein [Chloroflexota bacterium]
MIFHLDAAGSVQAMEMRDRSGASRLAQRTERQLPPMRQAIALGSAIADRYVGQYELAPGFIVTIFRAGERLLLQATGQDQAEIFPESATKFFLQVVDVQGELPQDATGAMGAGRRDKRATAGVARRLLHPSV